MNHLLPVASEMINGAWIILATSMMVMASVYLRHELIARGWSRPWTSGMRVALALGILSFGVAISHFPIWEWRFSDGESSFGQWRVALMAAGASIGSMGFLFANREVSRRLYGDLPWMATAAVVVIFLAATIVSYL